MREKNNISVGKALGKFRITLGGCLVTVVCVALIVICAVFNVSCSNNDDDPIGPPGDISGYTFRLGEVCEGNDPNGTKNSMVINDVYITDDISENKGNYIVFSGELNTASFSFPTDNSNRFYLNLRMIENPSSWEVNKTTFEKELSSELSSATLLYNGEEGSMNGVFSLVFSIGDENFDLIKQKTPNTLNFSISQISLKIGVTWCGAAAYFCFDTSDIRYVEK